MEKLKDEKLDNIEDSTQKENDYEEIVDRLESDFIAYLKIENNINFPLIVKNDIVALRKNDYYKPMDIVLYKVEDYYFLRRIIDIQNKKCYVCGDKEYDVRVIPLDSIIARAISKERGTKRTSLILITKDKAYYKTVMRKGKFRMKKHLMFDDLTTLTNTYDSAASNLPNDSKQIKNEETAVSIMPIDKTLAQNLAIFKSPQQRLEEFNKEKAKK